MATLRSAVDWTGREVDGVILGEPARSVPGDPSADPPVPPSGEYLWDHPSLPGDVIDLDGDVWQEVPNAPA